MLLVKCKCGCFFSIKNINVDREKAPTTIRLECQNCGIHTSFHHGNDLGEVCNRVNESGLEVQVIPDNATVKIEYAV